MTPDTPVTIAIGPLAGERGRVARIDGNYIFVTLDKHGNDRTYRDIEFGPFIQKELKERIHG